ncbi:MAG TPA: glycosyltransferase family 4 protein [Usitatibacter sp.]|jgi:glycosyltransferase involved in cell wall biosynthesis|nr:glycosyltransferase family 4 protein [Usitatibacter sp.]
MRVALVSPLHESVPPHLYGGTERVVAYLADELVALGHDVTLFATADSGTRAKLRSMTPRGLRLDASCHDPAAPHVAMLGRVAEAASDFDIVHFHLDYLHFPLVRAARLRALTTEHGRLDLPDLEPLFREFDDMALASISNAQRQPLAFARWAGTVYHGLPRDCLVPGDGSGGYLAFLGRVSPEKGLDRAIRIATRAGIRLRIAAKIEKVDVPYYESTIRPLLARPGIEFVGEIRESDKSAFLGRARALLFPIDWPEPFGLVQIEAMACGAPVIAYPNGSVPEIVEPGLTGAIVASEDEAVEAIARVSTLDRARIRQRFEQRYTAQRMARDYVALYEALA